MCLRFFLPFITLVAGIVVVHPSLLVPDSEPKNVNQWRNQARKTLEEILGKCEAVYLTTMNDLS